jgi:hypothetical protein
MLKELRELVSFVLGFLNDVIELIRTSCLSVSPLQSLGRDRALSLQLTGVVGIVLVGIFISTLSNKSVKIDLLTFGTITLIYFTIAAFMVGLAIRHVPTEGNTKKLVAANGDVAGGRHVDATSYVIAFNLIGLTVFAILRDVLNFAWQNAGFLTPAAVAAIVAGAVMLVIGRKNSAGGGLSRTQKAAVMLFLVVSFLGYAFALSQYAR